MLTFTLLVVGGLNWLLAGAFNWDIGLLFGAPGNAVARVIYVLVGLSAIVEIATHRQNCRMCTQA
jgi:hypothetical protein